MDAPGKIDWRQTTGRYNCNRIDKKEKDRAGYKRHRLNNWKKASGKKMSQLQTSKVMVMVVYAITIEVDSFFLR